MKKKLLVSFSGGETSAFMAQWLWKHKQDEYDMIFVFANTGQENKETLDFVHKCESFFGFPVIWVEAVAHHGERKGCTHKITDYYNASLDGKPFEDVISKYGIPNMSAPHCTRELKANPIASYARSIGWKDYFLAIGIRVDEIDRINPGRRNKRLLYPLVQEIEMTKPKINFWWAQQPFRLMLKGYQGNCKTCWKKHDPKLFQIAKESPSQFDFFKQMELKYGEFIPASKLKVMEEKNKTVQFPIRFFRGHRSCEDILQAATSFTKNVIDDAVYETEACEVFSNCGDE